MLISYLFRTNFLTLTLSLSPSHFCDHHPHGCSGVNCMVLLCFLCFLFMVPVAHLSANPYKSPAKWVVISNHFSVSHPSPKPHSCFTYATLSFLVSLCWPIADLPSCLFCLTATSRILIAHWVVLLPCLRLLSSELPNTLKRRPKFFLLLTRPPTIWPPSAFLRNYALHSLWFFQLLQTLSCLRIFYVLFILLNASTSLFPWWILVCFSSHLHFHFLKVMIYHEKYHHPSALIIIILLISS